MVGFAGSPRVGGNSDLLLDEVLAGASEAGAEVEKVYLNRLKIRPCQACESCLKPGAGRCITKDDMQPLYDKLNAADGWVLATPIYFWGPSAQMKTFVDRWYGLPGRLDKYPKKRAALVMSMADKEPETADPTIGMFEDTFRYLRMDFLEPLSANVRERGAVKADKAVLAKARALGRELAGVSC